MNVTILHGYSASNSGDGLLVDLAIALVQRNFGEDTSINVVASDPQSFAYLPHPRFDAPVMAAKGWGGSSRRCSSTSRMPGWRICCARLI
jgi:polysaccharide pyruvyl transferase WcaK-like protein